MSKSMLLSMTLALTACIFLRTTATAAETQRWDVQLTNNVAMIRVSKNTEHKFVTATIASLQSAGTEKFELSMLEPDAEVDIKPFALAIQVDEGVAEIKATDDLPYKILVSLISRFGDAGITKVKFAAAHDSAAATASQR